MDNPEKLATLGPQDEDKQNKIHNTICDGHHDTQTNTYNINKIWALLQTTGFTERTEQRLYVEIRTDITARN